MSQWCSEIKILRRMYPAIVRPIIDGLLVSGIKVSQNNSKKNFLKGQDEHVHSLLVLSLVIIKFGEILDPSVIENLYFGIVPLPLF